MIKKFKYYDFTLIITPILLSALGLVMVYSASMVTSIVEGHESTHYFIKQLQWFILGLTAMIFSSIFPYRSYQKLIKPIMICIIFLLIGVVFFGEIRNNARSWFDLGFISIQPAEFAKIGLIMYLASVYSKKQSYIDSFTKGVLPPLILTVVILALIIMQPDIGTSVIIFLIASTVILSSGIRFRHLFVLSFIGIIVLAIGIPTLSTKVRVARFTGAYMPFQTPDSDGYHLIQSYIAIGTGGFGGVGLGESIQKLGYLMEAHTDFIMAIIAEELGFVGIIVVIGMLAIIVLRGLVIARKCQDTFGSLLAIGISSMIAIQAFINLGAISGLLPITGVTLPFVSYGGSSLLVLMFSMGILNNIAKSVRTQEFKPIKVRQEVKPVSNALHNKGGRSWLN